MMPSVLSCSNSHKRNYEIFIQNICNHREFFFWTTLIPFDLSHCVNKQLITQRCHLVQFLATYIVGYYCVVASEVPVAKDAIDACKTNKQDHKWWHINNLAKSQLIRNREPFLRKKLSIYASVVTGERHSRNVDGTKRTSSFKIVTKIFKNFQNVSKI